MKRTILLLSFLCCGIILNAQNITDSLLLYYPFNGNANDYSGNSFNGSVVNTMPDSGVSGIPNATYYFNGVNSCINLPVDASLKPQLPVSLSFWVQFDDLYALYSQILTTDYTLDTYTGIWVGLNPSTYEMQVSYGDGTSGGTTPSHRRTKQGTTLIQTGVWYFMAMVIRGAQDMDIYIDCENDGGAYTGTGGSMAYTSNPGSIGRIDVATMAPYYFKGRLDELRYWNRALTQNDIEKLCSFSEIDEISSQDNEENLLAYPNPATESLKVNTEFLCENYFFTVFNIIGHKVLNGNLADQNNEIDLSLIDSGIYMLTVSDGKRIFNAKFIKQ